MGTRPEVIKTAPVIRRLAGDARFRVRLCVTAQHRELMDTAVRDFALRPHLDLDVMRPAQTLSRIMTRVIDRLEPVLDREAPDLVLVQGDTTTALGAAVAAFHRRIPVGHIEAGLRSFDPGKPFPEEVNRKLVDHLSTLLFAPTANARDNLRREGATRGVFVTGNTAVDALLWAAAQPHEFRSAELGRLPDSRLVVVTLHRRESFGGPLEEAFRGLREAADRLPEHTWVYPVHPNPNVRRSAFKLLRNPRIRLVEPVGYLDFVHLMKRCDFIVTDSGGIQDEASSLRKPVLVLRERTERPEALAGGRGRLLGLSRARLVTEALALARRPPALDGRNPVGDGRAAERVAEAIASWAGLSRKAPKAFQ